MCINNWENGWMDEILNQAEREVQSWPRWMQRPEYRYPFQHREVSLNRRVRMEIERLEELVEFNDTHDESRVSLYFVVPYIDFNDCLFNDCLDDYQYTVNIALMGGEFDPYRFLKITESNSFEISDSFAKSTGEQEVVLHHRGIVIYIPISWVFERKEDADEKLLWIGYDFFEKGEKYYREKLSSYLRKGDTK
jgi:hypothetical protein